jgi:hypothetical protein
MKQTIITGGVVCGLLLMAILGCGRLVQTGQNTAPSGNDPRVITKPTTELGPTNGDPRSNLISALRNRDSASSYRMEGSSESGGKVNTVTAEFLAPDRFHFVINAQVGGPGSDKSEVIGIGSNSWHKSGDKPWAKSPVNINLGKTIFDPTVVEELAKDSTAVIKYSGTESLGGLEMRVYEYSSVTKSEDDRATVTSTGKYWVGVLDNLPHKFEGQSVSSESGQVLTKKVSGTFDYAAVINIEPPI